MNVYFILFYFGFCLDNQHSLCVCRKQESSGFDVNIWCYFFVLAYVLLEVLTNKKHEVAYTTEVRISTNCSQLEVELSRSLHIIM